MKISDKDDEEVEGCKKRFKQMRLNTQAQVLERSDEQSDAQEGLIIQKMSKKEL